MCNFIHDAHQPIAKKGFGWKLFSPGGTSCFAGLSYQYDDEWKCNERNWFRWDKSIKGDGFCFFLYKKEALRVLKAWQKSFDHDCLVVSDPNDVELRRIEYRDGLCQQQEFGMIDGITVAMALCEAWRFAPTKRGA